MEINQTKLKNWLTIHKDDVDVIQKLEKALIFGEIDTNKHLTNEELKALLPVEEIIEEVPLTE